MLSVPRVVIHIRIYMHEIAQKAVLPSRKTAFFLCTPLSAMLLAPFTRAAASYGQDANTHSFDTL